jgi:toxin FitB
MPGRLPPAYLVDTNVLSNRPDGAYNPYGAEWLRRYAGFIRVSVITIAEMRRGLVLLEAKIDQITDSAVKKREKQRLGRKLEWYQEVVDRFGDKVEPIDINVAEKWAEISVKFPALRDGDKALAATAIAKGFGVATQNLGDFRASGVPLINPFDPDTWHDIDDDPIKLLLDT